MYILFFPPFPNKGFAFEIFKKTQKTYLNLILTSELRSLTGFKHQKLDIARLINRKL